MNEQREVTPEVIPLDHIAPSDINAARRLAFGAVTLAAVCVLLCVLVFVAVRRDRNAIEDYMRQERIAKEEFLRLNHRLRAEIAARDARYLAAGRVMRDAGRLQDMQTIQAIIDSFALEHMQNGSVLEMTPDDVRRKVCERLAAAQLPCAP